MTPATPHSERSVHVQWSGRWCRGGNGDTGPRVDSWAMSGNQRGRDSTLVRDTLDVTGHLMARSRGVLEMP
jgi:hypothetical protein